MVPITTSQYDESNPTCDIAVVSVADPGFPRGGGVNFLCHRPMNVSSFRNKQAITM